MGKMPARYQDVEKMQEEEEKMQRMQREYLMWKHNERKPCRSIKLAARKVVTIIRIAKRFVLAGKPLLQVPRHNIYLCRLT